MENVKQPIPAVEKKPAVKEVKKRESLAHRMLEDMKNANIHSNSHYCFYDTDGKYHNYADDVCYARLKSYGGRNYNLLGIDECRLYINQWKREGFDAEGYGKFVDYIVNRSIYANVFLSKRNWKLWGFRINCECSPSEVMAGMTAIRQGYEYPQSLASFLTLKDKVGEDFAFYASCFFSYNKNKGIFSESHMGGHGVLPGEFSVEDLLHIVKERTWPSDAKQVPMKTKSGGWSIFGLHKGKGKTSFLNSLKKHGKVHGEGWNQYHGLTEEQMINAIGELNVKANA